MSDLRSLAIAALVASGTLPACKTDDTNGVTELPTISSVEPTSGPAAGGTVITVKGTNLPASSTIDSVRFGTVKAPQFAILSDTHATVTTPPHPAGTVSVTLFLQSGETVTAPDVFTYIAPPAISAVTPSSGPTAGGTAVVISGSAFQQGATVMIGGASATGVSVTPTSVNATTPAGTVGAKNLIVMNPDGQADTAAFTYTGTSGGTPDFQDNFDTGTRAAPQNGYTWGSSTATVTVSPTRSFSGTHSLKFTYGPDAQTAGDDSDAEQRFTLGAYLNELWVEYMLYVPSNFVHRTVSGDTYNNKFFVLWRDQYNCSDGGMLLGIEYEAGGSGSSNIRPWSTRSTESSCIVYNITGAQLGQYAPFINNGVTPVDPFSGPITPGNWHQIRIHARLSSTQAATDGVLELWVNGTLFFQKTGANFFGSSGTVGGTLHSGYILGWANSGFTDLTEFFADDVKIYAANPNW